MDLNLKLYDGLNSPYNQVTESILKAASGVNDFNIQDVEIP